MNFRQLISSYRTNVPIGDPPLTLTEVCRRCGIDRTSMHHYQHGSKQAQERAVQKIADGLRISVQTVENALHRSRVESGLWEEV